MSRIYFQYFDLPFLLPRLALYMVLNVIIFYLGYSILKDLRIRKDYFDLDTHQSYSILASLVTIAISANVCCLILLEFLIELLLITTIYAILDSVYRVLIYYKRERYKVKYRLHK